MTDEAAEIERLEKQPAETETCEKCGGTRQYTTIDQSGPTEGARVTGPCPRCVGVN